MGADVGGSPVSPARGALTECVEVVHVYEGRDVFQPSPDELPAIDIRSR
jgi:hypothetical protein